MGQSRNTTAAIFFFLIGLAAFLGACRQKPSPAASTQPGSSRHATVASLVPAATDLILGMGAADHLVAVSNQEPSALPGQALPRVGDYQSTDWETLAALHPSVMIIQIEPAHLPPAFARRAAELNIRLLNVRLNTLDDLLDGAKLIGQQIGEAQKGEALAANLRQRLDAVKRKWAGQPRVKTLLALNETAEAIVGPHTFLDDLLQIAGGQNAAAPLGAPWPKADRETLLTLQPQVVIQLKPDAKPQTLERSREFWTKLQNGQPLPRIYLLRDPYVLLPGAHVADVAEAIERCLHENESAQP